MPRISVWSLLFAATATSLHAQAPAPASPSPADLIITGARIYTVDPTRPRVEALAVQGGRVVFVGSTRGA
ncbi:MAG: amidohydrolase, partial [Gemmatimonadota bacterium]